MKTLQAPWRRSLAGLVILTALNGGGATAAAADPAQKPAKKPVADRHSRPKKGGKGTGAAAPAVAAARIKVFRLRHLDPEELRQVVVRLLLAPGAQLPPMGPVGQGAVGVPGVQSPAVVEFAIGGDPRYPRHVRLAVDRRSPTLIARGAEEDVQKVAELVGVLDGPAGKPAPGLKNLRLFRLRFADVAVTVDVVTDLLDGARIAALGSSGAVVVMGPDSALKEAAEVIEALDVESKEDKEGLDRGPNK